MEKYGELSWLDSKIHQILLLLNIFRGFRTKQTNQVVLNHKFWINQGVRIEIILQNALRCKNIRGIKLGTENTEPF